MRERHAQFARDANLFYRRRKNFVRDRARLRLRTRRSKTTNLHRLTRFLDVRADACGIDRKSERIECQVISRASGADQSPSFFFSSSLTACGLALPPEAFITWPTNQPIAFGLVLASRDLVGIVGDDLVDHLLDRAEVGDLLHAALLRRCSRGSPPSLQTISNKSLAILPEIVPLLDQVEHRAELRRR